MILPRQLYFLVVLVVALALASCATPYQRKSAMGGYEDQHIGDDRWHISVRGNAYTSIGEVEQHFYRRARDIAEENGYDGYVVEKLETGKGYGVGGAYAGLKPRAWGTILCYKGSAPSTIGSQKTSESSISLGTGWKVGKGYVATNNHVVGNSSSVYLILNNGERVDARVIARDRANDLAVLSVDDKKLNAPTIPITDQQAKAGASVFTVGYPHPTVMGARPKVTDGIVSAATGLLDDPRTYQISVPLQSGNSGGPLLNMKGEVVGVATYKLNAAKVFQWTGDLPENVNYAVKVQYLEPLIKPLAKTAKSSSRSKASNLEELSQTIMRSVFIVVAE